MAPKDRGPAAQRPETAGERVVAADLFLMDRYINSSEWSKVVIHGEARPESSYKFHKAIFGNAVQYLLRGILMSTWGFLPAVFRPLRTVFPGLGAGFLNLGDLVTRWRERRKNGGKTSKNGREMA